MSATESIALKREVNVIRIPDGIPGLLPEGEIVTLHQSLGGTYTVTTEKGYMVRIDGADADALGKEPQRISAMEGSTDKESVEQGAWDMMRTVFDPEIPVNIVDLGLIYECTVTPVAEDQNSVKVTMTLTAPGCGMGPVIQADVEQKIRNLPGVQSVNVEVVFDPPWSQGMMSEVAKVELGFI
ncbi:MAG: putative Fe-S cluster assembly protein SufT [Gammaproteobacteria bacterium]|nr:MAG: putative Fe-S cluster assembly protein SufT [Gammaproteobacteria bacterium]